VNSSLTLTASENIGRTMPQFPNTDHFIVLKREGDMPTMAMCKRCQIKFFTPREVLKDPVEAEVFLLRKFLTHDCKVKRTP
jgi:hypothetical protein